MMYKILHRKLKNEQHDTHYKQGWRQVLWKVSSSCYRYDISGVTVNKGNNKITELRTILQRESQNS